MKWKNRINNNFIVLIGCLLSLSIFIVDILTPTGFTDYFWYISTLVFFMLTDKKKYIVLWSIINIVLIIIGFILSPENPNIPTFMSVSNRLISISIILIVMTGMVKFLNKQTELSIKVNELASANKELESFNYISSHDMQEPLRKLQIFASVLSEEINLSDHGKYYLEEMTKTSKQMRMLIDDLLEYSSLKNVIPNFEKINLNSIVEEVITNFRESIDGKKAITKIEGVCEANIDRIQFHQLMTNLIQNSITFSEPDRQSQITIKFESDYGNKLNPKLSSSIKYCHISIIDNGIGFDPEYKDRIFNFFERLDGQKYPGTGLGLTICKRIVENHSGIITATGEINKGAQFDIFIPVDRPESKTNKTSALFN